MNSVAIQPMETFKPYCVVIFSMTAQLKTHALLSGGMTWSTAKRYLILAVLMMQLGLARHLDKVLHSAIQK